MHNKLLINVGFYLLLIFAFTAAIYPPIAYTAAAGLLLLWLLDLLIFREPEFIKTPLYYPILGLIVLLLASWLVAIIHGSANDFVYLAFLSIFYFVVPGFVVTSEQRQMIFWTFATSILLYSGIELINWWASLPSLGHETIAIAQPHIAFLALAVCILAAFLTEAKGLYAKLFHVLVCLPPLALALLTPDKAFILALFVVLFSIALFRNIRLLYPIGIVILMAVLGLGGIHYYLERNLDIMGFGDFILIPIKAAINDPDIITGASFFGVRAFALDFNLYPDSRSIFLLELIKGSGPAAFLMIVFIFIERMRESYFKRRKVVLSEEKSYHLAVLMAVGALFILNMYGTAFFYPNVVLVSWMILGMYEI